MRKLALTIGFVAALGWLMAQEPPTYGPGEPTDHTGEESTDNCHPFSKTKPCGQQTSCKECQQKGEPGEYVSERMNDEGKYYCIERCHKNHCACPDPCGRMTSNGTLKNCMAE